MKKSKLEALCFDVLSHEIRREIINLLYQRIEMSYTELLKTLNIGDGLLNFHLKKMKDFITKTEKGTYILTEKGRLAYNLIRTVRSYYHITSLLTPTTLLDKGIVFRRIIAFLVDAVIFFIFTGIFLDPQLWDMIFEAINHLNTIIELHPWIFHLEHLTLVGELTFRLVGIYSHVFFAVYIFLTLLEAYKGQTPGKYLLRIRVVKIGGLRLGLIESAIRNAGKVFLLPLDLIVGLLLFSKRGFIRFFDYYTDTVVERVI